MTAGIGITPANFVAYLNAQFAANGIYIHATYANLRLTFSNDTVNFPNNTVNFPFEFVYSESTCFDVLGFGHANKISTLITNPINECSFTSTKIVDLSGNNGFYFTSNLGLGNHSFLTKSNTGGQNVLAKIQLTTSDSGIEYYNNLTQFKSRFYDTNITQLHIVLYDENFNVWVPLSDWSCVLEFFFYEKYDLQTKMKQQHLLFSN